MLKDNTVLLNELQRNCVGERELWLLASPSAEWLSHLHYQHRIEANLRQIVPV